MDGSRYISKTRAWPARYGVALASAALAVLIRVLLTPLWGMKVPFITLYPAVAVSAWYGGLGPGLVTTALCTIAAASFWLPPLYPPAAANLPDFLGLAVAVLTLLLITFLIAALARTNDALQQYIAEHARAEDVLRQRTAELEHSNEALQQFAHIVSHDLREPLRTVGNFATLLAQLYQGKLDPQADEFIGYVVSGTGRMQLLVQGLRIYTQAGSQGQEISRTDCEELFASAVQDLQIAIQESGALVTHDPLPVVYADRQQLRLVLQNLLSNALKFRGPGPPRVHVSAERGQEEWVFAVRDNGIGVAPEHTERIFQLFQRLHTPSEYSGTGIGLAICKKIVEQHGGRIWVESREGQGATFFFTLPVREEGSVRENPYSEGSLRQS